MKSELFYSRCGRAGPADIAQRMPELVSLAQQTISMFGLGCLGAPSAMEFARAGLGKLRVLDHDILDPATIGRWPFGLQAAGLSKVGVIVDAIRRDYPFTAIEGILCCLGAVRNCDDQIVSEQQAMSDMTAGTSLIYDATAEVGVQHFLSDYALKLDVPYLGVDATAGGWGGRVVAIVPGKTCGCWFCYWLARHDGTIQDPPMNPNAEIQPVACGDPTFAGAGFDLLSVALMGVRTAVSVLCTGVTGGYPESDWDVMTVSLRDDAGKLIVPQFRGYRLDKHPQCPRCNPT